jgi:hypothetical protein
MSNFVSPEPERRERKIDAVIKLAGDILSGRKPSDALREYKKTANKIKSERRLDKYRKY